MDNRSNSFFAGKMNNLGFNSYLSLSSNINRYYPTLQNNSIEKYFQKPKPNFEHTNYVPNTNRCLPDKINQSYVDFSNANAMIMNPIDPNNFQTFDNYRFLNSMPKRVPETNFSPALVRMQCLQDQIRTMEMQNMVQQEKLKNELESKFIGNGRFKEYLNNNGQEISKHNLRRRETQIKLEEMRKNIHGEITDSNGNDNDESFSEYKAKPKRLNEANSPSKLSVINQSKPVPNRVSPSVQRRSLLAIELNEIIPENKPTPFVDQLRYEKDKMENFTKNLASELEGLKDDIRRKMESVEQKQQESVELFRFVLEHGGNNKLKASVHKVFDKKQINIEEIEDDIPEYVKEFPKLIDQKVAEYEQLRKEEEQNQLNLLKEREKQHEVEMKIREEQIKKEVEDKYRKQLEEEIKKKEEEAMLVLPPINNKKKKKRRKKDTNGMKKKKKKKKQSQEIEDDLELPYINNENPEVNYDINTKPKSNKNKKGITVDEEENWDENELNTLKKKKTIRNKKSEVYEDIQEEQQPPTTKKKKKKPQLIEQDEQPPTTKKKKKKPQPIEQEDDEELPLTQLEAKKKKKPKQIEPEAEEPQEEKVPAKRPKTGKKKNQNA